MKIGTLSAALAAAAMTLAGVGAAQAQALTGAIWLNSPASATPPPPSPTPDANFNPGVINYQSQLTGYTPGAFLNGPSFTNESATFLSTCGANGTGCSLNNVFIEITGTVGLLSGANSFVLAHDDGVVLNIPGISASPIVNQPGPTSEVFTPFTVTNPGAAGNFAFTLDYNECCGAPADLVWSINGVSVGGVPEPATWALMVFGVGAIGAAMRSQRKLALIPA